MYKGRGLAVKFLGALWASKAQVISIKIIEKSPQQPGPIDAKELIDIL